MPHLLTKVWDRAALFASAYQARVRVLEGGASPRGLAYGRAGGRRVEELLDLVLELKPAGPGVVDFWCSGRRDWKIVATPKLG